MAKSTPRLMDPSLQVALDAGAEIHAPGKHIRMRSGAGHDAQYLAEIMPAAMLFIPSISGISHHWTENTHDDDIITGTRTLTEAAARILKADR